MPTYDYRCPEGHEFEHFFSRISESKGEWPCPVCGKAATRLISGGAGLVFKGSGFYLTDYGKNAHRKSGDAPKSDGGSKGEGGSKSEGSSGGDSGSSGASASSGSAGGESKPSPKSEPKSGGSSPSGTSKGE